MILLDDLIRHRLRLLLEIIPDMPFNVSAASTCDGNTQQSEKKRDALDKLITAHAISIDAILVTNNERDFKACSGLKLENWTENH